MAHAAESGQPIPPIEVRNFFDIVQSVYNYFSCSYRRWELLLSQSVSESNSAGHAFPSVSANTSTTASADEQRITAKDTDDSADEHDLDQSEYSASAEPRQKSLTLKSLSKTRWSARKDATSALLANFANVLECLAIIFDKKHDADEVKQAHDFQQQLDWTFLFTLLWWNDVLLVIDCASRLLQAKQNDLFMVADCFQHTAEQLAEMCSEQKFKEYIVQAVDIWTSLGFEAEEATFKQTRVRRKKRMMNC